MPLTLTGVQAGLTPQDWLGAHYPFLADECDRIPGLAATFDDILAAIEAYAEEYGIAPACFAPTLTITTSGRVIVDLGV
ncbi:MAG: hypothetical protein ABSD03_11015 [Vulcanimicrobiaceae bacterium]|jgi:hypothetical protein